VALALSLAAVASGCGSCPIHRLLFGSKKGECAAHTPEKPPDAKQ